MLPFCVSARKKEENENFFQIVMNISIICNKIISREGDYYEFIKNYIGSF